MYYTKSYISMTTCKRISTSSREQSSLSGKLLRTLLTCLSLCCLVALFPSCDDDDEGPAQPKELNLKGDFVTSIPAMPTFEPLKVDNQVHVEWTDSKRTSATVKVGAFTLEVGMMGKGFTIGEMNITEVPCTLAADGTMNFKKESFECQAGSYLTKGSLEGTYHKGVLKLTLRYKPGSMPFECQSVFTSVQP